MDNLPDIVIVPGFDNKKGVNKPVLATGMKPIIWNEAEERWDEITEDDINWYDYDAKKWANAKTADDSMWVWIPRYAYSIATCYHVNADTSSVFGDAVYETGGWYEDSTHMLNSSGAWLLRGGLWVHDSYAGLFYFIIHNGVADTRVSWRVVVMVGDEL